jgi:hypothetical protein
MFEGIWSLLQLGLALVTGIAAFSLTREFVRRRLRFVDAVRHPAVPWVVGGTVILLAAPIAAILPLVTIMTAAVAGLATGMGTASGVKAIGRGD